MNKEEGCLIFKHVLLRSLTLRFARVRGSHLMSFLCRSTKKGQKKRNPDVPSGASLPPAVLTMNGGAVCFARIPHLRGIYSTPQMDQLWQKFLLFRPA